MFPEKFGELSWAQKAGLALKFGVMETCRGNILGSGYIEIMRSVKPKILLIVSTFGD
jgi:hypothetical protein